MHGLPKVAALDVMPLEIATHGLGFSAGVCFFNSELRAECNGAEPEVAVEFRPGIFVEADSFDAGKEFAVSLLHMAMMGNVLFRYGHLPLPDGPICC